MNGTLSQQATCAGMRLASLVLVLTLAACGGGTSGNDRDSGANKTYLSVAASDSDGDALSYQWRVTAGTIANVNARDTVWTLPDGPGLHFAYVMVADGKGGYTEQQYAVSTDALGTQAATPQPVAYTAPASTPDAEGIAKRLRFRAAAGLRFTPPGGGASAERFVYLPDMPVQVLQGTQVVFSGSTDLNGEVNLPKLPTATYSIRCAGSQESPLADCGAFSVNTALDRQADVRNVALDVGPSTNLRLYGHVAFADGGICGTRNDFFGIETSATVQLLRADGQALLPPRRVNHFGDYSIDASVAINQSLGLRIRCESHDRTVAVVPGPSGFVSTAPVEVSHQIANARPQITKVVANGPEGNVRGRMIVAEAGALSNALPGSQRFLSFKGLDSPLSACMYYRSFGAVKDCDAQGRMQSPISFDDWKKQHRFAPYGAGNAEAAATYINERDLRLVRRMVATSTASNNVAFYVCNNPGPDGSSQAEVDEVIRLGLADERRVACVAMEWSVTANVNGGLPFTKFLIFGPDGALIPSVNLDGRGEKFLPGGCTACHGGSHVGGRFPEKGNPSPFLGARFLPFDTGNYLFSTRSEYTEGAQSKAFYDLNRHVASTEGPVSLATGALIDGWYSGGSTSLNKDYVAPAWRGSQDSTRFYREVIGTSCRTCHVALGAPFNWDALAPASFKDRVNAHACGGGPNLAINASMPNALASLDRLVERAKADSELARVMGLYLGCVTASPDPVYPRR